MAVTAERGQEPGWDPGPGPGPAAGLPASGSCGECLVKLTALHTHSKLQIQGKLSLNAPAGGAQCLDPGGHQLDSA